MCLGLANGYIEPKKQSAPTSLLKQDSTEEIKAFICRRCGINHKAICSKCKIHKITKIEVKE